MAAGNPFLDDEPAAPSARNPFLDDDTPAPATKPEKPASWGFREYATDGVRSLLNGVGKGVAGVAGLPADALRLGQAGLDYSQSIGQGREFGAVAAENRSRGAFGIPDAVAQSVSAGARAAGSENIAANLPTQYEPQSRAGKLISEAANFGTQAAALPLGGGGLLARTIGQGVIPGLASEAAGQLTEGSAAEPYARLGGALAGGLGAAYAGRASGAEGAATATLRTLPEGEREQILTRAQALLDDARARNVPLSTANAIDAASNGVTDLSGLQRHVEAMGGMRGFYAGGAGRTEEAARQGFDTLAPVPANPNVVGPQVGRAAEQEIAATQAGINRETRPLYQAAEQESVTPAVQQALADSDPLYAQTLAEIRRDPSLNRTIANLPDDSVAVQDLVSRRMSEAARAARTPGSATESNLRAMNLDDATNSVDAAAFTATGSRAATPQAPAVQGSLEQARAAQAQLRAERLEPLMQGPLGKLSGDSTTQQAIAAIFPGGGEVLANSQGVIADTMSALRKRNPWASQQLVRAHAEGVFNQAAKDLMSGPNANQGAKFASNYRGNPQMAANNDAAIRAGVPNGDAVADGFNRLLDVFEAMGRRQAIGSRTAYNAEELARMKQGGPIERVAANLASGGVKLPARIVAKIEEWRLGRNLDQLADLFTRPDAVAAFRGLSGNGDPTGALGRLAGIAIRASRDPAPMQIRVQPRHEDR